MKNFFTPCLENNLFPFTLPIGDGKVGRPNYNCLVPIKPDDPDFENLIQMNEEKFCGRFYSKSFYTKEERDLAGKIEGTAGFLQKLINVGLNFSVDDSTKKVKKYCIFSLLIEKEEISLEENSIRVRPEIEEEILNILGSSMAYKDKLIKLNNFIKEYGLLTPTKIVFGGRINYEFEEEDEDKQKRINSDLSLKLSEKLQSSSISLEKLRGSFGYYSSSGFEISDMNFTSEGGDFDLSNINDLDKWVNSLNKENSKYAPILYDHNRTIFHFLTKEAKKIYDKYFNDMDRLRKYDIIIKEMRKEKRGSTTKEGNCESGEKKFESGITDDKLLKYEDIFIKRIRDTGEIVRDVSALIFMWPLFAFKCVYNNVDKKGDIGEGRKIVGWKITSLLEETEKNGKWEMIEDPLAGDQRKYHFLFTSQAEGDIHFRLRLYYTED